MRGHTDLASDAGRGRREDVVEHRHPHDEPCAHLVADERGFGVGDAWVDLDSAVHRPRVHHDLTRPHARRRDPVERRVLAERRNERLAHPLALHAKDVDDIGSAITSMSLQNLAPERLEAAWNERRRPDENVSPPTSSSAWTSERATREWRTSPTIAT